jgi:hypothetical protein
MAKELFLKGHRFLVDDEDFEIVSKMPWHVCVTKGKPYAMTSRKVMFNGEKKQVLMHHVVRGKCSRTDHADGDSTNNQKYNLRDCNQSQNSANSKIKRVPKTSNFKGVFRTKGRSKPWVCKLTVNYRQVYGGYFLSEIEAAKKYDEISVFHFGEFALTNKALGLL